MNDENMTIDANDPSRIHLRRYRDGRVTVFAGDKELSPPEYKLTQQMVPNKLFISVVAVATNEVVISYQTDTPIPWLLKAQ